MYDSKTGIKIQRLTQAQYDHLFYLLLYSSKKHPRPWVNVKSVRRVIDYDARTIKSLYRKNLIHCPTDPVWLWTKKFRVRVSREGLVAFEYAQDNPETIKTR